VDSARVAAGLVPGAVRSARKEHFLILCLNARRQLVHHEIVSVGTLSASLVHPRLCSAQHKRGYVVDVLM
jgi:DNA repair protein RadC